MKKVEEYILKFLTRRDIVVIAVSTGVDSMVLFDVFLKLREKVGYELICAHVNHQVREESKQEEEFLKEFCQKHQVLLEVNHLEKTNGNFQSEARGKRYLFFDEVMKKYKGTNLVLAHHGDDLIETILMKLNRGISLRNNLGIKILQERDDYTIFRPFLFLNKEEIRSYALKQDLIYFEDASNQSENYTRNRFRKNILPFLYIEDKDVNLKYLKFSKDFEDMNNFVNKELVKYFDKYIVGEKLLLTLKKEDNFIKEMVIEEYLKKVFCNSSHNYNHVLILKDALKNNQSNLEFSFPNDITLIKDKTSIRIKEEHPFIERRQLKDGLIVNDYFFKFLTESENSDNFTIYLSKKEVKFPLYVRSLEEKDIIELNIGSQKVKKALRDAGVSKDKYPSILVVVDSTNRVIWLVGYKKSKYALNKKNKYDIIIHCERKGINEK